MEDTQIHFFSIGNGDAILIQKESNSDSANILIDAGKERNKIRYSRMRNEILSLLNNSKNGNIDLAIVTHSDDDHIGGFLNMVGDNKIEPLIQKYIFHSENNISNYIDQPYLKKEKYPVSPTSTSSVKSSYKQDLELTDLLKDSEKWDGKIYIAGNTICCNEVKLTILSPTVEKLSLLQDHWKKKKAEYYKKYGTAKSSGKQKCVFDYNTKFENFDFGTLEMTEDESAVNGASIAFVYEDDNTKGLFLSDAHPSIIEQSLKSFVQVGKNQIKFDFVKLSHHGSKNNLTKELLELIDCNNFIITANANKSHCHPNKQTLAMITQYYGESNVKFYFSEKNQQLQQIFLNETFVNYVFPEDGKRTITSSSL